MIEFGILCTQKQMIENDVSFKIRGVIFKVYKNLGPGLLESVYQAALACELRKAGCTVGIQVPMPVVYETEHLELGFRIDLLVDNLVIIEIKSVETLHDVHHKQILTYLRLSGRKLGILVNFNTADIATSIFRKVNNL